GTRRQRQMCIRDSLGGWNLLTAKAQRTQRIARNIEQPGRENVPVAVCGGISGVRNAIFPLL
ncbi:MAG: hypothetical protein QUS13_09475, partial [Smithella sp.]|nr:hypothetical protein [Smithella sp.]